MIPTSLAGSVPLRSIIHPAPPHPVGAGLTAYVLLDVMLVVILARLLGNVASRFRQPRAVGEIVAGILLGPTILGHDLSLFIAPEAVRPALSAIATLALVLFMFLVGVEFRRSAVRGREKQAVALGALSVGIPAAIGFAVAVAMHGPRFAGPNGRSFAAFGLFVGACLSVTALPVIAHVLLERGELNSRVGGIGLAAAAVASVLTFAYVGLASAVIAAHGYAGFAVKVGLIVAAIAAARLVVRPLVGRLLRNSRGSNGGLSADGMAIVFGGLLVAAYVADRIGVNALVGGFAWGVVMPADGPLRRALAERLRDVSSVMLLPVFFAYSGLSTDLRLLTPRVLPVLALVLVAAVCSKFLAAVPAKAYGMTWRETGAIGALMNTRGLVLLVVALIGLDLQVITPVAFTILVVTALVTNLMTGPLLDALALPTGEPFAQVVALTDRLPSR